MNDSGVNPNVLMGSNPQRILTSLFASTMGPPADVPGYGPLTVSAAPYNLNRNNRLGAGHVNEEVDHGAAMRDFLGASDRWVMDSEQARELLTVADFGRRASAVQARALIINQIKDPNTSPHFRVLPPREMTDAELAGVAQSVLTMGYTPPQEAAEFEPPHYVTFESELYQSNGYRFNHGFRFNMEWLKLAGSMELLQQLATRVVNDFIILMEQIVMAALMMVDDRYADKRLLWFSGVRTQEELMHKYKYRGPFTGASWLVSKSTLGVLQKQNGWEYLFEWVNDVMRARTGAGPTHVFIPPGITRDAAYATERVDYSKRGDMANQALMQGSEWMNTIIQTKIRGIAVVEQPTYEMRDSVVEVDQALNHPIELGQYYFIGNDTYYKHNIVQSARGIDSSAPRYACGFNDLYYLDYSTDDVVKRRQDYSELMFAALCWDIDGNLNREVYQSLEDPDYLRGFTAANMDMTITDINKIFPDPWIVKSDGGFKMVRMIGNQDVYHTSVEDTEFAIKTAANVLTAKLGEKTTKHVSKLVAMMHENYQVSPDDKGAFESFMTAVAYANVDHSELEANKTIRNLKRTYLPNLTDVYDPLGNASSRKAYLRDNPDSGHTKVLVNAPILNTDIGPLFDVDLSKAFSIDEVDTGAYRKVLMHIAGFVQVSDDDADVIEYLDILSLFTARRIDGSNLISSLLNDYSTTTTGNVSLRLVDAFSRRVREEIRDTNVLISARNFKASVSIFTGVMSFLNEVFSDANDYSISIHNFVPDNEAASWFTEKYYSSPTTAIERIGSVYLKSIHYRKVARITSEKPDLAILREKQKSHSNQFWITSEIVNFRNAKVGSADGETLNYDPLDLFMRSAGKSYFGDENISSENSEIWQLRMAYFRASVPLYNRLDLSRCTVATFNDSVGKLPGYANFEAMRSVAEQMKKRSDFCGWDRPWMKTYIQKIIKYVSSVMDFSSICLQVFCPMQSSQTDRELDTGMIFKSSILQKYIHHKADKEVSAKSAFSSIILDGVSRTIGMINPFTDYPILLSSETIKVEPGSAAIGKKHHFDCTFHFTDSSEIASATPYIIQSSARIVKQPDAGISLYSAYDYSNLNKGADFRYPHGYHLLLNPEFSSFFPSAPVSNADHMKAYFGKMVIDRLSKSSTFVYSKHFQNSEEEDEGVDNSGNSRFFSDRRYVRKMVEIMQNVYNSQRSSMEKSAEAFWKAVVKTTEEIKLLTNFVKDDESNPRDANDFKISDKQKKKIEKRSKHLLRDYADKMAKPVSEVDSDPDFQNFMSQLHGNFISEVRVLNRMTREHQYPVTDLGLSINGSYWREMDKKMQSTYRLSPGLGATISLLRPQDKHSNRFLDITLEDKGNVRTEVKMYQYKELVNLGPGDRKVDDIGFMLHKYSDKNIEVVGHGADHDSIVQMLDVNDHFMRRYRAICKCWKTRGIGLAYLTSVPTADLMVNLHKFGIPAPMTLLCFDPYIIMNMGSLVFVQGGKDLGWLGHHLTLHTTGFNSDTRLSTNHLSMWIQPHIPDASKILHVPNAIFQGIISGGSGRVIKSIANVRGRCRSQSYNECLTDKPDWDPSNPYERQGDRFVCYGGGSLKRQDLSDDINIIGNNHCQAGNIAFGYDLPLGLIPRTPDNTFSYPSALVFCEVTGYHTLNRTVEPRFLKPQNLRDIRQHNPSGRGGLWNVWCSSGKTWRVDPNNGEGMILVEYGSSPLKDINERDGAILKGAPTSLYQTKSSSVH